MTLVWLLEVMLLRRHAALLHLLIIVLIPICNYAD